MISKTSSASGLNFKPSGGPRRQGLGSGSDASYTYRFSTTPFIRPSTQHYVCGSPGSCGVPSY